MNPNPPAVKASENREIEKVFYHRVNNSTVAVVVYKSGLFGIGVSRCEKTDVFDEVLGQQRALATAHPLARFSEQVLRAWTDTILNAAD